MQFFHQTGKMAIGSRLRMLNDRITADAAALYRLYNVELEPKWWPVFHVLSQGENTIMAIAQEIGHSHPSVSKIVGEMKKKGLVEERPDSADRRRTRVALTEKGREMVDRIQDQYTDVNATIENMIAGTRHDLWKALEEWEFLLDQKSLFMRVQEQRKSRETGKVRIVAYTDKYKKAFYDLNEEWVSKYFKMEKEDYRILENPQEEVIDKGGKILVALYDDQPVGVCALIKMDDPVYEYEMVKMAVSPSAQGKNIGYLLGQAIINEAKALGAKAIYLESNTILKAAVNLYHKLGFTKVVGHPTPYERCNIQMGLVLET